MFKEKNDYHTEIPAVFSFSLLSAARAAATDGERCLRFSVGFPSLSGTVDGTVTNRHSTSVRDNKQTRKHERSL